MGWIWEDADEAYAEGQKDGSDSNPWSAGVEDLGYRVCRELFGEDKEEEAYHDGFRNSFNQRP